ncbi:MAG: hypothetical protein JWR32_4482 [Mycobacterium sp.]|jgi:hypothetical protein|nr:hypothetical protein [Mycobacterium sp.]
MPKFKGEEYTLRWQGRSGFARLSLRHNYPIVPVGLVGGDDVYQSSPRARVGGASPHAYRNRYGRTPLYEHPTSRGFTNLALFSDEAHGLIASGWLFSPHESALGADVTRGLLKNSMNSFGLMGIRPGSDGAGQPRRRRLSAMAGDGSM